MSIQKSQEEERLEIVRMRDVQLLLEQLIDKEEITIKLLIDSLYDIGSTNLINTKVGWRPANGMVKSVATLSKPAFRRFAIHRFKRDCPELITNWLHSKVAFKPPPPKAKSKPAQTAQSKPNVQPVGVINASQSQEIQQLRTQVKVLTVVLLGASAILGGMNAMQLYASRLSAQPSQHTVPEHPTSSQHQDPPNRSTQLSEE